MMVIIIHLLSNKNVLNLKLYAFSFVSPDECTERLAVCSPQTQRSGPHYAHVQEAFCGPITSHGSTPSRTESRCTD